MKLHLGCGKRFLYGYKHIDLSDYKHIDYRSDIKDLSMFEDETIDEVYSSHALEYFDRTEVITVLVEWFRVLKKTGVLRLAVPDFESLNKVYSKYKDLDLIIGPLYGKWEVIKNSFFYHKTVYDFKSLSSLLSTVGFDYIKRWDWKKVFTGKNKNFDDYSKAYIPHMDFEHGTLISLNIEAIK